MKNVYKPIKLTLTIAGCILLFSIPLIGIFIIWNFNLSDLDSTLSVFDTSDSNFSGNYNFEITQGEDELLTESIEVISEKAVIEDSVGRGVYLKISSVNIEGPIVYGNNGEELLRSGFWHYPATVEAGGNGVSAIFGHRRYHLPPASDTFYNLDKVKVGDLVELRLENGINVNFIVVTVDIINPSELESVMSESTRKSKLKLITCTPLGTSEKRLIVTAEKYI